MRRLPAQLSIHALMVDNIVSVHASWRSLQVRRAVNVRNPQRAQILCHLRSIIKCKVFMEL
jgi:hypothetical protein